MHEEAHFFKNPFHFNCHSNLDAFKSYRFHFMSIIHFEMNILGDKIEYWIDIDQGKHQRYIEITSQNYYWNKIIFQKEWIKFELIKYSDKEFLLN